METSEVIQKIWRHYSEDIGWYQSLVTFDISEI